MLNPTVVCDVSIYQVSACALQAKAEVNSAIKRVTENLTIDRFVMDGLLNIRFAGVSHSE
jgi:hypothetical protein